MRKATKKVTRKKNLSVKSNTQYVRNVNGDLFILKNGKLAQGRSGWRSVRLSEVRNVIDNNYEGSVTVRTKYKGEPAYSATFGVGMGIASGALNIGCQEFDAVNAAKILKRAKVTV